MCSAPFCRAVVVEVGVVGSGPRALVLVAVRGVGVGAVVLGLVQLVAVEGGVAGLLKIVVELGRGLGIRGVESRRLVSPALLELEGLHPNADGAALHREVGGAVLGGVVLGRVVEARSVLG